MKLSFQPKAVYKKIGYVALVTIAATIAGETAAQATQAIDPVIVIGRTPLPGLDQSIDQIPAAVQVIRAADIAKTGALTLADALNARLGSVNLNHTQGNPFQPDLNYRGFTASPLLGTPQGIAVYVDGVRFNQPFADVVSWDLLPRGAIESITVLPGSNPLFGLNALGGAISVHTKSGRDFQGTQLHAGYGSARRWSTEFEHGGQSSTGLDWYTNGHLLREDGWRAHSPSRIGQLFTKLGHHSEKTQLSASASFANNALNGNALQELRLLNANRASVYTQPDTTLNRSTLFNLIATHDLSAATKLAANAFYRHLQTSTLNADINQRALDQPVYDTSAGESATLTPFPFERCVIEAQRTHEPALACTGLLNRTQSTQRTVGANAQLSGHGRFGSVDHQFAIGGSVEQSQVSFAQTTQLGFLNANRSVTAVNAFADGVTGGTLDDAPFDNRVNLSGRVAIASVFATHTASFGSNVHLTVSARYNDVSVKNNDLINPGGGAISLDGNHRFRRLNPAAGISWSPRANVNTFLSYSESSRAPTTIELGCANPEVPCKLPNALAGDPPLKQVIARTVEFGLRGKTTSNVNWHGNIFRTDNRDDILFVADDQAGLGYFKNFGKTRRQGLELGLDAPIGALTLGLSYALLNATFQSPETVNGSANSSNTAALAGNAGRDGTISIRPGNRIPLLPQHSAKLSLDYRMNGQWSMSANATAHSKSVARGNENNGHVPDGKFYLGSGSAPGFATVNLSTVYQPSRSLQLTLRISNLFATRHVTAAQLAPTGLDRSGHFQTRPFGGNAADGYPLQSSTFYAPGAPRQFWLGLRYAL